MMKRLKHATLYPASHYVTQKNLKKRQNHCRGIKKRIDYSEINKLIEAQPNQNISKKELILI
jgi:hypothetical protein